MFTAHFLASQSSGVLNLISSTAPMNLWMNLHICIAVSCCTNTAKLYETCPRPRSRGKASWDGIDQRHLIMVWEVYVACQRGRCKRDRALLSHYHGLNLRFIAYYNCKSRLRGGTFFFAFKYCIQVFPHKVWLLFYRLSQISLLHHIEFHPV